MPPPSQGTILRSRSHSFELFAEWLPSTSFHDPQSDRAMFLHVLGLLKLKNPSVDIPVADVSDIVDNEPLLCRVQTPPI